MTQSTLSIGDRWCDADGERIVLFSWVEQVTENAELGILPSRLHQWGEVVGWGRDSVYVRFDDDQLASAPPHFLRLLSDIPSER